MSWNEGEVYDHGDRVRCPRTDSTSQGKRRAKGQSFMRLLRYDDKESQQCKESMVVFFNGQKCLVQLLNPFGLVQRGQCLRIVFVQSLLDLEPEGLVLGLIPLVQVLEQCQLEAARHLSLQKKKENWWQRA